MKNTPQTKEEWLQKFEDIGFGNQARIVGVKRVELVDFLSDLYDSAYEAGASQKIRPSKRKGKMGAYFECGNCELMLMDEDSYCSQCGYKVDW